MIIKNLSADLIRNLEKVLNQNLGDKSSIIAAKPVSGGSINEVYRLQTNSGFFILKLNDAIKFPNMFALEAEGLAAIRQTKTIAVPDVTGTGIAGNQSFLLLENIETGPKSKASMQKLGSQLAEMHQNTAEDFGFEKDNYMGSLPQSNRKQ
ncbi:MAG: fructosamine kinase, partial [Sphingobacteriaceae bacterium]